MNGAALRGVIVGASTLLGKELADELASAPGTVWDLTLLDEGETAGQMTAAGDEPLLIGAVTPEAFANADVVFFADEAGGSTRFADAAQTAGANIVDLSGALIGRPGMVMRSAWVTGGAAVDLATVGIVSPNPAALMLVVAADRLGKLGPARMLATVLQPASQQGSAGLDELHQQTVGLLSFGSVPKDLYDAQVAFSMRSALGGAAKLDLALTRRAIGNQFEALAGSDAKVTLALELLQAPVFHGFTASVFVQGLGGTSVEAVRNALADGILRVVDEPGESPSNESAAGQTQILLYPERTGETEGEYWLWMAADNLRLAAHHAVACAAELIPLRPMGNLQ